MGKFCYLGDMVSCYGGASEAVSARIGSAWNKSRELSGVLVWRQGLSLKQRGKVYQCFFSPVLLYCSETWELTVATEARLRGVGRRMIRRNGGSKSKQKLLTPVSRENWIKTDVFCCYCCSYHKPSSRNEP